MKSSRKKHCSFVMGNYLYVMFGYGARTLTYERIRIPPIDYNHTLSTFYDHDRGHKWEEGNIVFNGDIERADEGFFEVYNCVKTSDSKVHCFGMYENYDETLMPMRFEVAQKFNKKDEFELKIYDFKIEGEGSDSLQKVEEVSKEENKEQALNDTKSLEAFKKNDKAYPFLENVHQPIYDRGDVFLPIIAAGNEDKIAKWDKISKSFKIY